MWSKGLHSTRPRHVPLPFKFPSFQNHSTIDNTIIVIVKIININILIVYWLKNICPAVRYVERNILSLPDFKKDFGGKGCFLSTRSGLCRLGLGYWWSLGLPPYKHFVQNPGNKKLHWISTNSNRMTHTRVGKCIQQDTPAVCCTANAKGINKRSET